MGRNSWQKKTSYAILNIFKAKKTRGDEEDAWDDSLKAYKVFPSDQDGVRWVAEPDFLVFIMFIPYIVLYQQNNSNAMLISTFYKLLVHFSMSAVNLISHGMLIHKFRLSYIETKVKNMVLRAEAFFRHKCMAIYKLEEKCHECTPS
ncbi:unnamed protein product [Lactuca saligna]|uniref:Uncharacterized protein n=1 Tax=Lactuca saligna TaxID=75948 RepID=A0AA36EPT7_LACSI|nr:unnamed protein product [Lactuca saligna]